MEVRRGGQGKRKTMRRKGGKEMLRKMEGKGVGER